MQARVAVGQGLGSIPRAVIVDMSGVPLDQLHCPTCGVRITNYNLFSDTSDEQFIQPTKMPPMVSEPVVWYIVCPNGHKWTVKMIWRAVNHPDRVQLGEYVGHA